VPYRPPITGRVERRRHPRRGAARIDHRDHQAREGVERRRERQHGDGHDGAAARSDGEQSLGAGSEVAGARSRPQDVQVAAAPLGDHDADGEKDAHDGGDEKEREEGPGE
jgi:hypothetical protein